LNLRTSHSEEEAGNGRKIGDGRYGCDGSPRCMILMNCDKGVLKTVYVTGIW
jgi:hypothetical protein